MDRSEWVLVPRVPTEEMCEAAPSLPPIELPADTERYRGWKPYAVQNAKRYAAMLAAAPPPPAEQASGDDLAEQFRRGWEAGRADALSQRPVVDEPTWRDAFVAEWARRYRSEGMKIEQARIQAETAAQVLAANILASRQPKKGEG